MSKEPHKHKYDIPYTETVRLSNYAVIEGQQTSTHVGTDTITGFKCSCGLKQAINLEREKV